MHLLFHGLTTTRHFDSYTERLILILQAITCYAIDLPEVSDGFFDCVSNSYIPMGDVCTLSCRDGFYPAFSHQAECMAGTRVAGVWSYEHFECNGKVWKICELHSICKLNVVPNYISLL